jgi:hypothetical protein
MTVLCPVGDTGKNMDSMPAVEVILIAPSICPPSYSYGYLNQQEKNIR